MSSTNEELSPPPKPRVSPLEYRNTDLVSRLLAATPPYLYNSPMVPHTYFFSEMLRSFVQAKTQEQNRNNPTPPTPITPTINPNVINTINTNNNLITHRRSRKRGWNNQLKATVPSSTPEMWTQPQNKEDWPPAAKEPKLSPSIEKPLELTINKVNKITHKISDLEKSSVNMSPPPNMSPPQIYSNNPALTEPSSSNDLILPPPPPIWYPPIYPTPYGIDPFHFFIDLRVSGHIYDRKKESQTSPFLPPDVKNPDLVNENNNAFKPTRHTSAFSVPIRNGQTTGPINLSNGGFKEDLSTMKTEDNKVSTNYVMQNLQRLYNKILDKQSELDDRIELDQRSRASPSETSSRGEEDYVTPGSGDDKKSDGEDGEKCKDLSALIGLELVVDYVKHEKPKINEDETIRVDSPDLEIIETHSSSN